ncbi:TonB-dependent receptor [Proteiniphilum sp.]|uniref:SusC/RagA family TonB-linked outer membrane protein n=1 Tax=Proteiniphilum sp. TaxID=1926877 RepID=UPI002B20471C|nr:TonB-dependent receptor [Proteiniphilum sp.]MEA4917887.1 TonB-dependent receptor [Proteiniphilum sp.]
MEKENSLKLKGGLLFLFTWMASFVMFAQNITVTGTVTDSENNPLPGVTITVVGSPRGVITDIEGNYSISVLPTDQLQFSFVGLETKVVPVNNQRVLNVVLEERIDMLEEVTVVAFATQKRENVVGAVTTINPSELKVPSSNLTTALAGRVAGVISYQRSGEPGLDNADFFIRGVTTFGYKKDPLILIDGIESSSTDLARLQTDDIASFSILKDATATSLYGSRAANGVILIKTKEGKEGKAKLSLRVENYMSMPTQDVELADPITYMNMHNEAILTRDPLGILPYTKQKIDYTASGLNKIMYPVTDWKKELIKDHTMNHTVNLNVSGGGTVARYFVSGGFAQNSGLLKVDQRNNFNSNIDLKTYSVRTNVNVNLTKTTQLDVRVNGTFDEYTGPITGGTQVYRNVMRTNPVMFAPYYEPDADHAYVQHILFGNYDDGSNFYYLNPYAEMVKGYKTYSRSLMTAQFEIKENLSWLLEGLRFRIMANTRRNSYFETTREYIPFWYQASSYDRVTDTFKLSLLNEDRGTEWLNYNPGSKEVSSDFYSESVLSYDQTFNKKHVVNGLFVFLTQNRTTGNASTLEGSLPYRNINLAMRATYTYDSRYNLEFNLGADASERFHKSHRWGAFPSYGFSWNVSNEHFWKSLKNVANTFRIRGTYGQSGNDAIGTGRFLYLSEVNMNDGARSAVFGRDNAYGRNGISIRRYSDPEITWEIATKSNLGLELGLLNAFQIQADIYKEVRSNILQTRVSTPAEMGLSAQPQANIGKAEGKGIDISVDYNKVFNKDLWLQGRFNFTYAKSKFLIYEEYYYNDIAPWRSRIGYSINQSWGYLAERLFVDDEEASKSPKQNFGEYGGGDIKYRDMNNDGQITELDLVPIGYPTVPEIVYGFGFSLGYKNIDLSMFFQGLGRESFWINPNATAPFREFYYSEESLPGRPQNQLLKAYADDYWSEDNQNIYALWPRLSTSAIGHTNNSQTSTWFMRDGSFLRLKQLEIGYTFPSLFLKNMHMENFRIYFTGTNLFNWSKFDLWDVEMGGNGLGYPIQKSFNVGLQLNF